MNGWMDGWTDSSFLQLSDTHMRIQGEVQVLAELSYGGAAPVLKHVKVGLPLKLQTQRSQVTERRSSSRLGGQTNGLKDLQPHFSQRGTSSTAAGCSVLFMSRDHLWWINTEALLHFSFCPLQTPPPLTYVILMFLQTIQDTSCQPF